MNHDVLAIILGGGRGTRLWPLTQMRAKPAVPFAGRYRLIDIPMSNCIHSGFERIAILTQFLSVSLHRHVTETYRFDRFRSGWVQLLAAEQTHSGSDWYQGTADAVRKQLGEVESSRARYVVILSGDQLYRMDYARLLAHHIEHEAEITIGIRPIPEKDASRFGVVTVDATMRCTDFAEKPTEPAVVERFKCRDDEAKPLLGSMGIYVFNRELLSHLLTAHDYEDFGHELLPAAIPRHRVFGFPFDGYWEDIGTIRSYYEANLALTEPECPFNFRAPYPIYPQARHLPSSHLGHVEIHRALIAEGCQIEDSSLKRSVVGVRSVIRSGSVIEDTVLCGCDYYEHERPPHASGLQLGIGKGCQISGAIIDKNVRIGHGVVIRPFARGTEIDTETYCVRDGIVVIPKGTVLEDGSHIGP